ncbi:2OG-Fe(II) oxygenase [Parasphingopyxis algicola]|uniref:2OG-Fe(II) oxygenase n=1 Tax=Parasphingopyxis algicola TaxID=2026624 RepID=UPI0015A21E4F|nr:2OG-Fe(II) oxygenase [Parasphingopyxis algicola]QLC23620.1 2OG-Fe(II) oxygenase [Parasphingopyxis algicola]
MENHPVDIDGAAVAAQFGERGFATVPDLLAPEQCDAMIALYREEARFRKRIVMARHGYGSGEYQYFAYPLPPEIAALRSELYAVLAPLANRWQAELGIDHRFPADHADYLDICHRAGQERPTPLLLKYGPGDFNRLHQDVYGEHLFPVQVILLLSEPGADFTGGELIVTEQRARMQARAEIVPLGRGDAAVIAVRERPGPGARGPVRMTMRHGVSRVRSGERYTLGTIFHDAA